MAILLVCTFILFFSLFVYLLIYLLSYLITYKRPGRQDTDFRAKVTLKSKMIGRGDRQLLFILLML